MTSDLRSIANAWLKADPDPETRAELEELLRAGDEAGLRDRFGTRLAFGTAGLRGLLGAGTNRMNRAIVIQTTEGLGRYLLEQIGDAKQRGVVVGYDGRKKSRELAEDAASVLAALGIRVHLFPKLGPTPLTAFAVLELGAAAGVMITASHNPPAYNGYKVYWQNGAQIIPPHDVGIAEAIERARPANEAPRISLDDARQAGLLSPIPSELSERYLERVEELLPHRETRPDLSIVVTPLHGAGGEILLRALERCGFEQVAIVPEQAEPDAAFPTVAFPNPEEPGAMDLALALAARIKADVVMANDPDADRLAIAVPNAQGEYVQLTGNEVGVLLGHYLLTEGDASGRRLVISTIVSSPMLGHIANELGVSYEETLTGFKWIANRAMQLEQREGMRFVFGYEEALGYSVGHLVRDKDGISAACVFGDLVAHCKAQGRTVLEELERIARRYGLYVSAQRSVTMEGGLDAMAAQMRSLRASLPKTIADKSVLVVRDYLQGTATSADGKVKKLELPASDVLAFELEGGDRLTVRPSGTEPKIKLYVDHREPIADGESLRVARDRAMQVVDELLAAMTIRPPSS